MTITVLSPHRDDAAFSVGLAIEGWLSAGHRVRVLNCFTKSAYSPCGGVDDHSDKDGRILRVSEERRLEDRRWSSLYDRTRERIELIDMDLWDAPQRLHCSIDEVCGFAPDLNDSAIAAIRLAVQHGQGALVLPLGIGNHVDHVTARIAAQAGWPKTLPMAFYEDLPYSARPGGAEEIAPRAASLADHLETGFVGGHGDRAHAAQRKRDFARCYDSQVDAEVVEQIAGFCERYDGRERLWMNRAWCAAGLDGCR